LAGVKNVCRARSLFYRLVHGLVSLSEVFFASRSKLLRVQSLCEKVAGKIKGFDLDSVAECELKLAYKESLGILTLESPEYSPLLKFIYDSPLVFYLQGKALDSISF
jgi:predicted Rossmann fold nucleotide-binding protein DprA/Smf involved in DNA uptake